MSPVQIVGGFLNGLFNYLQTKRTQGEIQGAWDAIEAVNAWVGRVVTAIAGTQGQEQGAVQYSAQYAQQIGHDFEQIEGDWEAIFDRLLKVILPHSFSHLAGYISAVTMAPLRNAVKLLQGLVDKIAVQVQELLNWKQFTVTPALARFDTFLADFFKGDQPAINILNDWLTHPADFGQWAAAPVVGPIVAYLADETHDATTDNLSAIMLRAWLDHPLEVLNAIEAWLVQPIN